MIILVVILNILQDADLRQCLGFSYQILSSKKKTVWKKTVNINETSLTFSKSKCF